LQSAQKWKQIRIKQLQLSLLLNCNIFARDSTRYLTTEVISLYEIRCNGAHTEVATRKGKRLGEDSGMNDYTPLDQFQLHHNLQLAEISQGQAYRQHYKNPDIR
jgi:hypothetical protein